MSIGGIVLAIVLGFIAGLIARAIIPGRQKLGFVATVLLGLIGSIVGNVLSGLLFHGTLRFEIGGWWASIIGAVIVLGLYVMATGRRAVTR